MYSFLKDCHQVEELAGKIYQQLAVKRTYAPEIRKVFQRLSDDERSHAQHLNLAMQASPHELEAVAGVSQEKIVNAKNLAEKLFQRVNTSELSEETALRLAVQMEEEFIKIHVHNSLHFGNETLGKVFSKLKTEDQSHVDVLNDCIRWWVKKSKAEK
jgi:rubrerythrin